MLDSLPPASIRVHRYSKVSSPRLLLDDIAATLSSLAASTPARDIERNAKALLGGAFARMDLVTREEFDVQRQLLVRARERIEQLEARIAELEARPGK